jgi:monoamine oxidase
LDIFAEENDVMRTPLARHFRNLVGIVSEAEVRQVSVEQVQSERISRRKFLQYGAVVGVGAVGASAIAGQTLFNRANTRVNAVSSPHIAIVGAGLAGLTCGYRLKQAGIPATIYEATGHVGGRCHTIRNVFDQGQIAEMGGELIDTDHTDIIQLAQELGLQLDDLQQFDTGTVENYFFRGHHYTSAQAIADIQQIWPQLQDDANAAGFPTQYNSFTHRGFVLDHMSIKQWINAYVPGGEKSKLGMLLDVAYTIEFGVETEAQSALNLIYLIAFGDQQDPLLFGSSDERYHVRGGNDQIATLLANKLADQVQLHQVLVALKQNHNGSFTLTFTSDAATHDVVADKVVLTIPFSVMRAKVDYSQAGFSLLKRTAITELGMGTNTKLQLQFNHRIWRGLGFNGTTYADTGYQNTWEPSRAQPGLAGLLVDYTGGKIGASFTDAHTPQFYAQRFLQQIEPVIPGISAQWNGKVTLAYWTGNPWTLGSYSYWKVGQYTKFSGIEGVAEGNCHFAGEHTSVSNQGFLDGAVETGQRAASEIVSALGKITSKTIARGR